MKFKNKLFTMFTLVFAFLAMTVFVSAQETDKSDSVKRERKQFKRDGAGRHGGHRGGKSMRFLRGLDLTDAQKTQIQGIMEASRVANEPLRTELQGYFQKKRSGENLTDAEQNRIRDIKTQMKQSMEQTHNTIMAILTPEQRQQVEQRKLEREKRREEFRQRREERKNKTAPTKGDA